MKFSELWCRMSNDGAYSSNMMQHALHSRQASQQAWSSLRLTEVCGIVLVRCSFPILVTDAVHRPVPAEGVHGVAGTNSKVAARHRAKNGSNGRPTWKRLQGSGSSCRQVIHSNETRRVTVETLQRVPRKISRHATTQRTTTHVLTIEEDGYFTASKPIADEVGW